MDKEKGQRLWRLRKLHQFVDAELRGSISNGGLEVQFFYNGELAYARRLPSRILAVAEADAKRSALEREGWVFHW
jgi:hypothetical protein